MSDDKNSKLEFFSSVSNAAGVETTAVRTPMGAGQGTKIAFLGLLGLFEFFSRPYLLNFNP